jgi:hypothetical protein
MSVKKLLPEIHHAAMMPILLAEQLITTLYPWSAAFVAHRRSPYRADPAVIMGELWIEEEP